MKQKKCTKCLKSFPATRDHFGSTPSGNLRGACRTCMNARSKDYDRANPSRMTKRGAKPSADFGYSIHAELLAKQNHKCVYCNERIGMWDSELDHKTPISKGGANSLENLHALCSRCNREKHNKTDAEHRAWRRLNRLKSVR